MERLTKYIAKQFGKPTGIGGIFSTFLMNRMNQRQYRAVIDLLDVSSKSKVLDIGYGNGYLLHRLAKLYSCTFYGIEISSDMLHRAVKRNKSFIETGRVHLSKGSVEEIPFKAAYFQRVYTVNTVYFWSDLDRGMSEINRVLCSGGLFLNVIYSKEWLNNLKYTSYGFSKYTLDELEASARRCGFTTKIIEIKSGDAYCICCTKV